jgi:Ulp1 family protease
MEASIQPVATPQQENCSDCGVFVLEFAERLCSLARRVVPVATPAVRIAPSVCGTLDSPHRLKNDMQLIRLSCKPLEHLIWAEN